MANLTTHYTALHAEQGRRPVHAPGLSEGSAMAYVTLTTSSAGAQFRVSAPYEPEFVQRARELNGRYDGAAWVFDIRDADRVRALCLTIFGTAGGPNEPTVSVRITVKPGTVAHQDALRVGGRVIAAARGRDSGARLGDAVVSIDGKFSSGGSVKNWQTTCIKGATVIVRDLPAAMATRLIAGDRPDWIESVQIEPEVPVVDPAALHAEREQLLARIKQIDALLSDASAAAKAA